MTGIFTKSLVFKCFKKWWNDYKILSTCSRCFAAFFLWRRHMYMFGHCNFIKTSVNEYTTLLFWADCTEMNWTQPCFEWEDLPKARKPREKTRGVFTGHSWVRRLSEMVQNKTGSFDHYHAWYTFTEKCSARSVKKISSFQIKELMNGNDHKCVLYLAG